MITIISGTNRNDSVSLLIAHYYKKKLLAKKVACQLLDLGSLPADFVYSALYENTGKNKAFNVFQTAIESSDKFLFVVPEYNGSFPGVLKAFIDGLKYPHSFRGKKCALVGISSGKQGAGLALSHLTDVLNYMGMHVLPLKPKLSKIEENMSENILTNQWYIELLETQTEQLIKF